MNNASSRLILILDTIRKGWHEYNGRKLPDFPFLRGNKIGPLWLRMLRDNVGFSLKNLDRIPIPVDIHVARATLALGVVRGRYAGNLANVFQEIRKAWFAAVKRVKREDGSDMIALDFDELLWHLSKNGCTHREADGFCPRQAITVVGKEFCVTGIVKIDGKSSVVLDT